MRLLLFTTFNCKACSRHQEKIIALAHKYTLQLKILNVDDEQNFSLILAGMREFGIKMNPSTILFSPNNDILFIANGIKMSVEHLEEKILKNQQFFN